MNARRLGTVLAVVLTSAILQAVCGPLVQIHGARPDFVVVFIACCGALSGPIGGMAAGFWGGLLSAALVDTYSGSLLVSRLASGAVCGWLQQMVVRDSLVVPPLVTLAGTLAAEAVTLVMTPESRAHGWIRVLFGAALYNMVLSIPAWLLLRKLGLSSVPKHPFDLRGS
jgi:LytS/YehU family sensor histidine kinase